MFMDGVSLLKASCGLSKLSDSFCLGYISKETAGGCYKLIQYEYMLDLLTSGHTSVVQTKIQKGTYLTLFLFL